MLGSLSQKLLLALAECLLTTVFIMIKYYIRRLFTFESRLNKESHFDQRQLPGNL